MLALSFFLLIFSSLLWIIYAVSHLLDTVGLSGLQTAGIAEGSLYAAYLLLPVFAVWMIFGIISQFLHDFRFNRNLNKLFIQMKKNQDYSDLIARIMLESEQQIRDGFIVQQFDLFVSDMNDLISEIIQRSSLASPEQIERLWNKVRNGGKWAFGKVVIEVNQSQPTFQSRIYEKAGHDIVLAGTIMEFCARYQNIVELFEKHDNEKIFLNIIETGVLGKVFSIFVPISDELKRKREASQNYSSLTDSRFEPATAPHAQEAFRSQPEKTYNEPEYQSPQISSELSENEEKSSGVFPKFSLGKKFPLFNKKKHEDEEYIDYRRRHENNRDPFSIALERSFGEEPVMQPTEPTIEAPALPEEDKVVVEDDVIPVLSNTQRTLDSLRREWEQMNKSYRDSKEPLQKTEPSVQAPAAGEDAFGSPFRSWVDEENYK